MFTIEDNLTAFSDGDNMKHMPYAAPQMAEFMIEVGFIPEAPDFTKILDKQFIQAYAAATK